MLRPIRPRQLGIMKALPDVVKTLATPLQRFRDAHKLDSCPFYAPEFPCAQRDRESRRCDSLKLPSLASASGPSGGLMAPELAH